MLSLVNHQLLPLSQVKDHSWLSDFVANSRSFKRFACEVKASSVDLWRLVFRPKLSRFMLVEELSAMMKFLILSLVVHMCSAQG